MSCTRCPLIYTSASPRPVTFTAPSRSASKDGIFERASLNVPAFSRMVPATVVRMASPLARVFGSRPFTTMPSSCCVLLYHNVVSTERLSFRANAAVDIIAAIASTAKFLILTPPRKLLATMCRVGAPSLILRFVSLPTPPMKLRLFVSTFRESGTTSSTPPIKVWMSISSSSVITASRKSRRSPPQKASSRAPWNGSPLYIYSSPP